jgi:hypothetical protein
MKVGLREGACPTAPSLLAIYLFILIQVYGFLRYLYLITFVCMAKPWSVLHRCTHFNAELTTASLNLIRLARIASKQRLAVDSPVMTIYPTSFRKKYLLSF